MAAKPEIAVVGAGNLGSALARALHGAGYRISEIVSRAPSQRARRLGAQIHGRVVTPQQARWTARVVWICVPDSQIAGCARKLAAVAEWGGKIALHSSGALASDELQSLRRRGAAVATAHPLMTFVRRSRPTLTGVPFGVEGEAKALPVVRRIVRDLGGEAFPVRPQDKALYHAWGAFASPMLIALLASAEQVARAAGVRSRTSARKRMLPILSQTLRNYGALGPADAFSGPLARGDVATVRRHLAALDKVPPAKQVYLALARATLQTLPLGRREEIEKTLKENPFPRRRVR